jgi:PII-like signaling protein
MQGSLLRFYVHEGQRHEKRRAWEWLLGEASRMGVRGGSAFRAVAGFGSHHVVHENTFFELAGTLTVEVEFIVTDEEASQLIEHVRAANIRLFYARLPAQFDVINPTANDPV